MFTFLVSGDFHDVNKNDIINPLTPTAAIWVQL